MPDDLNVRIDNYIRVGVGIIVPRYSSDFEDIVQIVWERKILNKPETRLLLEETDSRDRDAPLGQGRNLKRLVVTIAKRHALTEARNRRNDILDGHINIDDITPVKGDEIDDIGVLDVDEVEVPVDIEPISVSPATDFGDIPNAQRDFIRGLSNEDRHLLIVVLGIDGLLTESDLRNFSRRGGLAFEEILKRFYKRCEWLDERKRRLTKDLNYLLWKKNRLDRDLRRVEEEIHNRGDIHVICGPLDENRMRRMRDSVTKMQMASSEERSTLRVYLMEKLRICAADYLLIGDQYREFLPLPPPNQLQPNSAPNAEEPPWWARERSRFNLKWKDVVVILGLSWPGDPDLGQKVDHERHRFWVLRQGFRAVQGL